MIALEWIKGLVVFLLMISVLVAAHEYGHYLFARIFKMGIEEFAIGFGPKVKVWLRKTFKIPVTQDEMRRALGDGAVLPDYLEEETEYTIRALPLGGFVRIKGMVPEEDGSEVHVPGGFYSKAPWKRLLVLLAGPLFSVIAGVFMLFVMFASIGEKHYTTAIFDVTTDGAAYAAGLRPNDVITAIDGTKINTYYEFVSQVRDRPGVPVLITFKRGEKTGTVSVVPRLETEPTPVMGPEGEFTDELRPQAKIGVIPDQARASVSIDRAAILALEQPVVAVEGMLKLFTGKQKVSDSAAGPLVIFATTKKASDEGIWPVIQLSALLSISVGILNLLPVTPFDGGQIVVAFVELLRGGRRLSLKFQGFYMSVGLALIGVLIVGVLYLDVSHLSKPEKSLKLSKSKSPP